jgi:hypothetical protein
MPQFGITSLKNNIDTTLNRDLTILTNKVLNLEEEVDDLFLKILDENKSIQRLHKHKVNRVSMIKPYLLFDYFPYNENSFIGLETGIYRFNGITIDHPLGFITNSPDNFKVTKGTPYKNKISVSDQLVQHYIGDIEINILGDFGNASYHCLNHGFMGGENKFKYIEASSKDDNTSLYDENAKIMYHMLDNLNIFSTKSYSNKTEMTSIISSQEIQILKQNLRLSLINNNLNSKYGQYKLNENQKNLLNTIFVQKYISIDNITYVFNHNISTLEDLVSLIVLLYKKGKSILR